MPAVVAERISAALCILFAAALWVGPYLLRADLFPGDASQHVFWLYGLANSALFPGDPAVAYFSSGAASPIGYRLLYTLLVPSIDAQIAAELVAVLLIGVTGWLAWSIGVALDAERRAVSGLFTVVAVFALIAQPADLLTPMGLQRSFALPITLLCLWSALTRRYAWIGVSWLLAAAFYPIVIVVTGLAGGLVCLLAIWRERRWRAWIVWNAVAGVAALSLVLASSRNPPGVGPTVSGEQALRMTEFGAGGRLMLHEGSWVDSWFRSHLIGLGWSPKVLLVIVGAVALIWFMRGSLRRIPAAAWLLLASGLAAWAVARATLFLLYLPNRHTRWSVAAFALVALAIAAVSVFDRIGWSFKRRAVAIAAPLIVALLLYPHAARAWQTPIDRDLEAMYSFIATLPAGELIAAHPDLANDVPLRSRHSVLACTETVQPFMLGYYARMKPRLEASLRAAYAASMEEIDRLLGPYGVDAMLTGPSVWRDMTYDAPFDEIVANAHARARGVGFAMQRPPADRVIKRFGDYYLIRVEQEN